MTNIHTCTTIAFIFSSLLCLLTLLLLLSIQKVLNFYKVRLTPFITVSSSSEILEKSSFVSRVQK